MASSAEKATSSTPAESNGVVAGENGNHNTNHNHAPPTSAPFRANDPHDPSTAAPQHLRPLLPPSAHSTPNSPAGSAKSSRETSPVRPQIRSATSASARLNRSRKNSQDLSPNRTANTPASAYPSVPSAAAVQRALAAANKTTLQPTAVDGPNDSSHPDKNTAQRGADSTPHWPGSPRLKSPPPPSGMSNSRSPRRQESDSTPSNTSVKRLAAASTPELSPAQQKPEQKNNPESDDAAQQQTSRSTGRGASGGSAVLETVEEASLPATPSIGPRRTSYAMKQNGDSRPERIEERPLEDSVSSLARATGESGSESGGNKSSEGKAGDRNRLKPLTPAGLAKSKAVAPQRSQSTLNPVKAKASSDAPVRSMTVETETVSSVPQVSLGGAAADRGASGRVDAGGSVRLKPSNETIRPKKEKKRSSRKPTSGAVSSKADIFEAKVANAVDEANSSDSEETFVYESNPPETHASKAPRHHSRTPSATSMASQYDQYGSRYKQGARDGNHSVAGKRSMKFTNSTYNQNPDGELSNQGSGRGSSKNATTRHHHIGRYGRGGHPSLFDSDSPFPQANKAGSPRASNGNLARLSRPNSPRTGNFRNSGSPRKGEGYAYDVDGEGADDERTPLINSVRINRRRRPNSARARQAEWMREQRGYFSRYGACMIVTLLLLILVVGAGAFVVALTKPLLDVSVKHIQNVLASEQEIMLDLDVRATNPNLFAITVNDMDVNIFAKSGFVGSNRDWRGHGPHPTPIPSPPAPLPGRQARTSSRLRQHPAHLSTHDGIDEGTDPIEDPEGDPQTMLLGRIFEFDSPLTFEPSPMKRKSTSSVGQVRLAKPGNETEEGGTARWERVIQHPFELIVRGVIKYQLPLSSRYRSASIGSRIKVYPENDDDDEDDDDDNGVVDPGKGSNKSTRALPFVA